MDGLLIAIIVIFAVVCVVLAYYLVKVWREYRRAREEFMQWIETEQQRLNEARKQAIEQSRAVLGGKFTEQMTPYLPEFKYDPTEARFIGSPIDLIVFPGLAIGEPREVVLIEVKTSGSGRLTTRERKIQDLVEANKVRWELIYCAPVKAAEVDS